MFLKAQTSFRLLIALFSVTTLLAGCFTRSGVEINVPDEKGPVWGFIDHSGKFVLKPKYRRVKQFTEGLAAADLHTRWGFIDRDGKFVIERAYEDAKPFSAGYAAVQMGGKWGAINKEGVLVLPCKYEDVGEAHECNPDAEDHAVMLPYKEKQGEKVKWGFKDLGPHPHGDIAAKFDDVMFFNDGLCPVYDSKWGKWGFINAKGEQSIQFKFDRVTTFKNQTAECEMGDDFVMIDPIGTMAPKSRLESTKAFHDGLAIQQKKGKFAFINREGRRPFKLKFRYAENFSEGLAVVQPLQSVRRGYIDTRGEFVIPPIFDDARAFSEQLAAVKVDPDEFFKSYNEDGSPKSGPKTDKTSEENKEDESKDDSKEESKDEAKEESKDSKDSKDSKEESKDESTDETKDDSKDASKDSSKDKSKAKPNESKDTEKDDVEEDPKSKSSDKTTKDSKETKDSKSGSKSSKSEKAKSDDEGDDSKD